MKSKSKRLAQRIISIIMSVLMVVTLLPAEFYTGLGMPGESKAADEGTGTYTYNIADSFTAAVAAADLTGDTLTIASTEDATVTGTIVPKSGSSKIDASTVEFETDGITGNKWKPSFRYNTQGGGSTTSASFRFTTQDAATIKVWWVCGGDGRQIAIWNSSGTKVGTTEEENTTKNSPYISELSLTEAGTYYIGSASSGTYLYQVQVIYPERDQLEEYTDVYNFAGDSATWKPIIDEAAASATAVAESPNGYLKIKHSATSTFKYNGAKHGVQMADGGTVEIAVYGNTTITVGGCHYSSGTVKLGNGETHNLKVNTHDGADENANCPTAADLVDPTTVNNATKQVVLEYEGENEEATAVLTFDGTTYVPYIIVSGQRPKATDVEVAVTTTTTNRLYTDEKLKVYLVNSSDATDKLDVTTSGTKSLTIGTTYKAIVTDTTDGEDIDGLEATIDDKASFTAKADTSAIAVKVVTTTTAVTPTIEGTELGTNYVVAKDAKTNKTYRLTSGTAIELPKNTNLTVVVMNEDNEPADKWTAAVGESDTFNTGTDEAKAITITANSVSNVVFTPVISGKGLLGDNVVYFVEKEDTANSFKIDADALENGVILKPNTEYNVVLKTAANADVTELMATVKGATSFKTELKNETVTVEISTPMTDKTVYNFAPSTASGNSFKEEGAVVSDVVSDPAGRQIIIKELGHTSGITVKTSESQLRKNNSYLFPINSTTTKVVVKMTGSGTNAARYVIVGHLGTSYTAAELAAYPYKLQMNTTQQSVTVPDIAGLTEVKGDQTYICIQSCDDVKIKEIIIEEYEPVNDVTVSGTITGAAAAGVSEVSFKNLDDEAAELVKADVAEDGKYTVTLKRINGETNYAAVVAVAGYKIDDADNKDKFVLVGNEATATVDLAIAEAPMATISGTLTGPKDAVIEGKGDIELNLVPDNTAMAPVPVTLTKVSDGTYSFENVRIEIDREYTPVLTNADDYEILSALRMTDADLTDGKKTDVVIAATMKPVYKVSGKFVTSNDAASDVTRITFTNIETPAYTYSVDVTGNTYEIELRDAAYETSVVSEAFEPFDHVLVEGAAVTNDVYLIGEEDTSAVEYKAEVTVGAGKEFATIMDAVNYISRMTRTGDQRVTILLDKDAVYREQVIINTPNVTIKGDNSTITWYYGVGFSYYSACPADGNKQGAYYDEKYAVDKYTKTKVEQNPGHWGATVNLFSGATGFKAEDVIFENSLNRYLTEEELADGADANELASITARTAAGIDVTSKNAKERSAVLYIQADNTEYKNCKLLSRQDTLYTGDSTENSYFKNCLIEGTVDYICGDGNAVFDGCTLSMYGYPPATSNTEGSYIVANKAKANHGYLFNACEVVSATGDSLPYSNLGKSSAIVLARAWDAGTVYWLNTKVEAADSIAAAKPYLDMNAKAKDAHYYEYNTYYMNGDVATKIATDGRTEGYAGTVMDEAQANAVVMTDFFDDWIPTYYEGDMTVSIEDITLTIAAPVAGEPVDSTVSTKNLGFTMSDLKWYAGETEFTGKKFGGTTVYTAKIDLTLDENYVIADDVTVTVAGSKSTAITKNEDGTYTVSVTYEETAMTGYWEYDFPKLATGLETSKTYAGGIMTVLADMPYNTNGYVKGSVNPKNSADKSPTGDVPVKGTAIKLVTPEDEGDGAINRFTIKSKASGKAFYLVRDDNGKAVVVDTFTGGSSADGKSYTLDPGSTYYYYASGSNQEISYILVEHRVIVRGAWDEVADPEITRVAVGTGDGEDADMSKILVYVKGMVGDEGADSVSVDMMDAKGDVVATLTSLDTKDAEGITTFTFKPTVSGNYTFKARLEREGEATKYSAETESYLFDYVLDAPQISTVTNKGLATAGDNNSAKLEVVWYKVTEARKYKVAVSKKDAEGKDVVVKEDETIKLEYTFEGLTVGDDVTVSVTAVRRDDDDVSPTSTKDIKVTGEYNTTWAYASYGSNASKGDVVTKTDDGITINAKSSTKLVPGSTDGLLYYYTKLDGSTNFTLTAKINTPKYTPSNGQEGFGIMVSDRVGEHGDGTAFWNNSYQIVASQIQYNWDPTIKDENGKYVGGVTTLTSDSQTIFQNKMRLGVGWTQKEGVTLTDVQKIATGEISTPNGWSSGTQGTFETSVAEAVMKALYDEELITDDSTPAEVQAAYGAYRIKTTGNASAASYGQMNIIGGMSKSVGETVEQVGTTEFTPLTEFLFQIQRSNTGYILRYLDVNALDMTDKEYADLYASYEVKSAAPIVAAKWDDGTTTYHNVLAYKVLYDDSRNKMLQIDKKNMYVGFFSARVTSMNVAKFGLVTISPDDDDPADPKVKDKVLLQTRVLSGNTSNTQKYDLVFTANADGALNVINTTTGKTVAANLSVSAGKRTTFSTNLATGANKFKIVFTPSPDYVPGANQVLDASNNAPIEHIVTYEAFAGDIIYVAPNGTTDGTDDGIDKAHPTTIYQAVAYAKPGQKIYMAGGNYMLGEKGTLRLERGNDGTADAPIYLQTDPEDFAAGKRAVLNFSGTVDRKPGITVVSSYWYFKDFDVTHSANGQDGILLAGKHNVLENLHTYENGNTGIQIARDGSDGRALWPSDNLILNCTSYLNWDEGFEDADGFAAKLTCGENNRFVGCVSAYNADDGWDLFAKVQTGSIGVVTIESCVAYKNGYMLGTKGSADTLTVIDYAGAEFSAGNGNGFKMGGDGMSGYHVLKNSVAYGNKANGIDSNSCPDIQVFNSTSYANGTGISLNNYATSINSDYTVNGVISMKNGSKDSISMLGNQIKSKIYNKTNYFWDGKKSYNAADSTDIVGTEIFQSTDPKDAGIDPANGSFIARDAKGNIQWGGFLQLTDAAKEANSNLGGATPAETDPEKVITVVEEISVFAGSAVTLSEIALPDSLKADYTWKYPETVLKTFDGTSAEFIVVNKNDEEDEAAVIVNFVEVTGVELVAEDYELIGEDSMELVAKPVYTPATVDLSEVSGGTWSFTFTDKAKMALTASAKTTTIANDTVELTRSSASKEGIAKYNVAMQLTTGKKTVKKTSAVTQFVTRKDAYAFDWSVGETTPDFIQVADAEQNLIIIGDDGVGKTFNFTASVEGVKNAKTGAEVKDVKIAVGDTKVLKYNAKANSMSVVAPGTTYITLTSTVDKTVVKMIPVTVLGQVFKVNTSLITLDKAKTSGIMFKVVETRLDASVTGDLSIKAIYKGAKTTLKGNEVALSGVDKLLDIEEVIDGYYMITASEYKKNSDGVATDTALGLRELIANGSYTVVLQDEAGLTFEPFVLKVTETKPNVSFKQSKKVNLYYAAGTENNTGFMTANCKLAGVNVEQKDGNDDYSLVSNGNGYDIVMSDSASEKIYTKGAKLNNKIPVTVSFDGYKAAYNKDLFFNVGTVNRAPKYVLEIDNAVLYTQLGIEDTEIRVFNKDTGTYVSGAEVTLATSKPAYAKANANFVLDESAGTYTLAATKSGTAKISVIDPEFGKDKYGNDNEVILNARLTVNTKAPTVTVKPVALSAHVDYAGFEQASAPVIVRNALDYTIKDIELSAKNAKAAALLPYLSYEADVDELTGQPVLLVTLQDSDDKTLEEAIYNKQTNPNGVIKAGSYSFSANITVNRFTPARPVNVTVKLTAAPSASSKVKGKLDLLNRAGSQLKVTGNIKNLNGTICGMEFGDDKSLNASLGKNYKMEYAADNLFDIAWDSAAGAAIVTLKEDGSYRANGRYKVVPVFIVATPNGEVKVPAKPITINTKQASMKFEKLPVLDAKLGGVDVPVASGTMAIKSANVELNPDEPLTQLNGYENFVVDYDPMSGGLDVYVYNTTGLKANKTYSIKLAVNPVGEGAGSKKQIVTVKVKVTN